MIYINVDVNHKDSLNINELEIIDSDNKEFYEDINTSDQHFYDSNEEGSPFKRNEDYDSNYNEIVLNVSIPDLLVENVKKLEGEIYQTVNFEGCSKIGKAGHPQLPIKTLEILLPYGKDYNGVKIETGESQIFRLNHEIEPAQKLIYIGSEEIPKLYFDEIIYNSDDPYPNEIYSIVGVYEKRGYRILVLNLYPIQYLPQIGLLKYYKEITLSISLNDYSDGNQFFRDNLIDQDLVLKTIDNTEILDSYRNNNLLLNSFDSGSYLSLSPVSYDYVIITNEEFKNYEGEYSFKNLTESKIDKGITATIVSVESIYTNYTGIDKQEKIRNFIIDAYLNWGTQYILLGGDSDGSNIGGESEDPIVPARGLYGNVYGDEDFNIPADIYYAGLDGSWDDDGDRIYGEEYEADLYGEVFVGRAPIDSIEELHNFVKKTLMHEESTDPYLTKALMVGEDLGWAVWGGDYKDEIKYGSSENGYTTVGFQGTDFTVDILYDRELDPLEWNEDDLIPLIEDGYHIINHLGHANVGNVMKMTNSDVDSLSNNNYFFGYSQGCYDGAFDNRDPYFEHQNYDCIVEHLVNTENGSFAFIGNSRYGWGSGSSTNGPSQHFDRQFFDAIFGENITHLGWANQDSKEDNIGLVDSDAVRWCYYQLNLFGDPMATISSHINNQEPSLSSGSISPSSGNQLTLFSFTVEYTDQDNNQPVFVQTVINDTYYQMEKYISSDNDYKDGCTYECLLYLQPGIYEYYFKCFDGNYINKTEIFTNLIISESDNENSPTLYDAIVDPNYGVNGSTIFKFSVKYHDLDNNAPVYVNLNLNSSIFTMVKQDIRDMTYMDGCTYIYTTKIDVPGTYSFFYDCSDGDYNINEIPYNNEIKVNEVINYSMYLNYYYDWIDATSGTELTLEFYQYERLDLPFEFEFYSFKFDEIYVSPGGFISFVHPPGGFVRPESFPSVNPDYYFMIAPYWDVLDPEFKSGKIFVTSTSNYIVIEWLDIHHYFGENIGTFEIVLYDSGEIIFNYKEINFVDSYYEYTCGLNLGIDNLYYNSYQGLNDTTQDFAILFKPVESDFEPKLTQKLIIPTSGSQTQLFTFEITYSDDDNNSPIFLETIINGTPYRLTKKDQSDSNYTDGCVYNLNIYLQPGQYEYYFKCYDGLYYNSTLIYYDLIITEIINENEPTLTGASVNPNIGFPNFTTFEFSIIYTDLDNNAPEFLNISINSTILQMFKMDIYDTNYMDGCTFICETYLEQVGEYYFNCTCSDGSNLVKTGNFTGPVLIGATTKFYDDFENGLLKWDSISSLWHITSDSSGYPDTSHSPTHSIWFGDDLTGTYDLGEPLHGVITSISINLSKSEKALLEVYHWREKDYYDDAYFMIDCSRRIHRYHYYSNVPAWERFYLDISDFCGFDEVTISFGFICDETDNAYRGWVIDDVSVYSYELDSSDGGTDGGGSGGGSGEGSGGGGSGTTNINEITSLNLNILIGIVCLSGVTVIVMIRYIKKKSSKKLRENLEKILKN